MMTNFIKMKPAETSGVRDLLSFAAAVQKTVDPDTFIDEIAVLCHDLPDRLIRELTEFRLKQNLSPLVVISGLTISDGDLGPTPNHWNWSVKKTVKSAEEIFLMLCGAVLGDPICWATQQGGKLVHDILPIKGLEHLQTGASSDVPLEWHTEEAFHELRPDYIGLLCLRNPGGTATTVGRFETKWMSGDDIDELFQPKFQIEPDSSHLLTPSDQDVSDQVDRTLLAESYKAMAKRGQKPIVVPILSGARDDPFICIDPAFMRENKQEPRGDGVLSRAIKAIDAHIEDIVLRPGDVAFIDNARLVHGRKPFTSRHDGSDRWLKRISLTRDLSKSRHARTGTSPRIIY